MLETYRNEIPDWVFEDDTFLFHGTSNLSEQNLDFGYTNLYTPVSFEIVDNIVSIYKEMPWWGKDSGGYGVLNSYSNRDRNEKGKYFFLGETAQRCALYASKEFAGGELTRSVYHSINDLNDFLTDVKIREHHKRTIEKDYEYYGPYNPVDLDWLAQQIVPLKQILSDLEKLRNSYKYGIIYVYKIEEEDYTNLIYSKYGMGFKVLEPLAIDRLKVKLIFDPPVEKHFGDMISDKLIFQRGITWAERIQRY